MFLLLVNIFLKCWAIVDKSLKANIGWHHGITYIDFCCWTSAHLSHIVPGLTSSCDLLSLWKDGQGQRWQDFHQSKILSTLCFSENYWCSDIWFLFSKITYLPETGTESSLSPAVLLAVTTMWPLLKLVTEQRSFEVMQSFVLPEEVTPYTV